MRLLPVPPGPDALSVRPDLERALAGTGPALLPVAPGDARLAGPAPDPLTAVEDDPADPTALVVFTSGSTGDPKGALLPASALRASAAATYDRLGGPGSWLLALPPHHIAGLQVLLRSMLAGTSPRVMDLRNGFSPNGFLATTDELTSETDGRRYVSLVPTQLTRLLERRPRRGRGPRVVRRRAGRRRRHGAGRGRARPGRRGRGRDDVRDERDLRRLRVRRPAAAGRLVAHRGGRPGRAGRAGGGARLSSADRRTRRSKSTPTARGGSAPTTSARPTSTAR